MPSVARTLQKMRRALFRVALRYSSTAVEAEDLLQEAICEVLEAKLECKDPAFVVATMKRRIQMISANQRRKAAAHQQHTHALRELQQQQRFGSVSSLDLVAANQTRARLQSALRQIHPRYARAIIASMQSGSSVEACRDFDVSPATFRKILSRARKALRDQLKATAHDR